MSTPLRTLVHDLLHDATSRADFAADPAGYLDHHGWGDLDGDDVATTLGVLVEELPIDDAIRLDAVGDEPFGDGPAGAIDGLRAAVDACAPGWPEDPAFGIDGGADAAVDPEPPTSLDDADLDPDPPARLADPTGDPVEPSIEPDAPGDEWASTEPAVLEPADPYADLDLEPTLIDLPGDEPPDWPHEETLDHD